MKDIKGYEGLYGVTSCGRVWSYKNNRFLEPQKNSYGYLHVTLYKDGETNTSVIHKLVAEAYIQNTEGFDTVDHIDGCKTRNNVQNLQYLSRGDNARKANNKAVRQYDIKGNLIKVWSSAKEAGRQTVVNNGNISSCCRGERKTAGGFIWRFENV